MSTLAITPAQSMVAALLLTLARIVLGIWLFAAPLPLRDGARWRVPCALVGLAIIYLILAHTLILPNEASLAGFVNSQFVSYSLLLVSCVGALMAVCDANMWVSLFCCASGYTVQNLASGMSELAWVLLRGAPLGMASVIGLDRLIIELVSTLVVFSTTYLTITRGLRREGLERIADRWMLFMMAITILVIIGFDLLVKAMVLDGLDLRVMVILRIFHGLACVFTLTMEFQLLITKRAEAARDAMGRLLAERERHYDVARGNVAAINARLHDIRHSVADKADHEGLGRDALRDMLREIAVYDSRVRTGNEAIDTALTERKLTLGHDGIALSCMVDGAAFSFMEPADAYALFSSLLEGAAASGGSSISLTAREALGTASVHVECRGQEPPGLWADTLSAIVARYGGTLSTMCREGSLHINILFPERV